MMVVASAPLFAQGPFEHFLGAFRRAIIMDLETQDERTQPVHRLPHSTFEGPFRAAIENKDLPALAALLRAGEIPERPRMLLRLCLEPGQTGLLRLALRNRFNPNLFVQRDGDHQTPLSIALLKRNFDAARALILYGARFDDEALLSTLFKPASWGLLAITHPDAVGMRLNEISSGNLPRLLEVALVWDRLELAGRALREIEARDMHLAPVFDGCFKLFAAFSNPRVLLFVMQEADRAGFSYSHSLSLALASAIASGAKRTTERLLRIGANPLPVRILMLHRGSRAQGWRCELEQRFKLVALIQEAQKAMPDTYLAKLPKDLYTLIGSFCATELPQG